ncbi:MAG: YwiC-like family protein [Actinomycetota bacterium]
MPGIQPRPSAVKSDPDAAVVPSQARPRIRSIALPTEHGGWGFTLEPILLGLLVAPSGTAWELSVVALAVFLARRPVKFVSTDLVRRRWYSRTTIALAFSLLYGTLGLAGIVGAFVTAEGPFWIPVIVAGPLALFALRADAHTRNRGLAAELSGSIAMGSTVAAIALGSGWDMVPAFGLWLILAARDVAAIVLVRGQVRRLHDRPVDAPKIYAVQLAAVAVVAVAAFLDAVPWLGVVAVGLVGVVAVVSLNRSDVEARVIGWTQMGLGLAVVLVTALGVRLGI